MSAILKALEDNRLVYFVADERRKRNAMVVPFFGRPAYTAVGPAVFSKKTGAPIVPIFVAQRNGGICVDIMPAVEDSSTGDHQEDIRIITERANRGDRAVHQEVSRPVALDEAAVETVISRYGFERTALIAE